MKEDLQKIIGQNLNRWDRKLIKIKGSFYINIPRSIIAANGKKAGAVICFTRVYDEKSGKVLVVLEL
jgi:hypothetical protein